MDEELKNRFFQLKLSELLNDSTKPFPTMIFEMERPEMIELIRRVVLFSRKMLPYTSKNIKPMIKEGLDKKDVKDYGELYVEVFLN